jgi:hypothetical protein
LCFRSGESRYDTLLYASPLELGDRSQDVQLELARWCRGVDAFSETDEGDTECLKVIEQRNQVFEVAAEPIEAPAHEHVGLPTPSIGNELVESWPLVLRTADATVYVLDCAPATSLNVAPKLLKLILGLLVEGRDASVDCRFHR